MKVIIGKTPGDFKIIGESGADLTKELMVKHVHIDLSAGDVTVIVLDIYGEAEVDSDNVRLLMDKVTKA